MGRFDGVKTTEETLQDIYNKWTISRTTEKISLEDAINRVLAEDVKSEISTPMVRSSQCDGICISYDRYMKENHLNWKVGIDFDRADTGDDFPDDFDTVIAIEDVLSIEPLKLNEIQFEQGDRVNQAGAYIKKGEIVLHKDTKLTPMRLAALRMVGKEELFVYRKPVVAFIPTGNELENPGSPLERGKVYDSNSIMVKHLLLEYGANPLMFSIVKDIRKDLEEVILKAVDEADIILINGGSSKGKEDLNTNLIKDLGVLMQHKVACPPGFPVGIGFIQEKPIINIPGPPVGCFNVMDWCIKDMVSTFLQQKIISYEEIEGILSENVSTPPVRFMKLFQVRKNGEEYIISANSSNQNKWIQDATSNAFIRIEKDKNLREGDYLTVRLLVDKNEI